MGLSKDKYKVEGSGVTIEKADAQFQDAELNLFSKLKKANVPGKPEVTSTLYDGEFTLRADYEYELNDFTVQSQNGGDRLMFYKTIDLDVPIKQLKKGLTKQDIQRGAQNKVFDTMINSWLRRQFLFVKQYKKGLQKILAIS